VQDLVELVDVVATFEEGLSSEEFGEDASNGPDVDWRRRLVVVTGRREKSVAYSLWCSFGNSA